MKLKDWHVALGIFILVASYAIWFNFTHNVIYSDVGREYQVYLKELSSGHWIYVPDSLVNSCLFTTLLPAIIQNIIKLPDNTIIFRLIPCLFLPLIPIFTYLIARKYCNKLLSIGCTLFVITHFFILRTPAHGRVEIGWAFLAILFYALLNDKKILTIIMSLLIPFSHYATNMMLIPVLGLTGLIFIKKRPWIIISCLIISLISYFWYFRVATGTGNYILGFFMHSLDKTAYTDAITKSITTVPPDNVALAFLYTWVIMLLILWGYYNTIKNRDTDWMFVILAGCFIGYVGISFIPFVSAAYGIGRVYFTGLPLFSVLIFKYLPKNIWLSCSLMILIIGFHAYFNSWCPF